ncbi:YtpR family tRNA-binding protein, partial [Psychrobacillus psychrotolerans]|uniref:YtpR family tRNA-binding protein n=1 Tax=Psychrobacillus psychrotolerans TaxID=126156 RepID=UPI003C77DAD8
IETVQKTLEKNGVYYTLEADLSPKFVVGLVDSLEQHPNADKLKVCQVNVGESTLQIVCGAPNVEAGQKVVVAKVGAIMPSGMVIKDAELRGVASSGMLCSARELAIPNAPEVKGILILDEQKEVGSEFIA